MLEMRFHQSMPDPQNQPAKPNGRTLDVSALESWLWDTSCTIPRPLDAPKSKDYILPLIFLKRLSDVFDDEIAHMAHERSLVSRGLLEPTGGRFQMHALPVAHARSLIEE